MPEYIISGIPVNFPFEPYNLQKVYMEKVIECLENRTNGVLESPTGTGKTLSLLCSTLAWIMVKKAQVNSEINEKLSEIEEYNKAKGIQTQNLPYMKSLVNNMRGVLEDSRGEAGFSGGNVGKTAGMAVPKVIYASRTHSQISQAMQELKRTSYNNLKAAVIGSREQLCIHPDVMKETTHSNKIHLCKLKITTKSCSFYHRVESRKNSPEFRNIPVLDIEDLVKAGRKLKCCPYFVSKDLIAEADIVFMPYNYLLDPKTRKANKVELFNTIIILDEAHNVEKMCEDSASVQISSSEVAVCIDDVTHIMKAMTDSLSMDAEEISKDFTIDDLVLLKQMLLNLEKAIDEIHIPDVVEKSVTFPGAYIFELLGKANITDGNFTILSSLLETLVQYLTTVNESNAFVRRGGGLQKLQDLLIIVYSSLTEDYKSRISKCYKVYVEYEEQKPTKGSTVKDGWIQPKANTLKKSTAKIVSYWCFSPGFGMQHLLGKHVRSIILTSGTLAPLKPLISELGIPISVRLENPHIISNSQICVKIVSQGPDKEPLISNYANRDNPKFISSLGRTILSFCPVIPHGLLVFFTSYFMLNKCRDSWQASGIWSQIQNHKTIYIEPKTKDAFNDTMNEYYEKIHNPATKGAIFMAVCRGKVSEGLDFADMNGRAVIITGLPFPPYKDPRIILKKKYLQENRTRDNEMLSGDDWYFLEAIRAVNQAIGRVIRHKDDYGAILLCDFRFNQPQQKNQLSSWIQEHLSNKQHTTFGPLISEVSRFFRNAERTLPQPRLAPLLPSETSLSQSGFASHLPSDNDFKFEDTKNQNIIKSNYSAPMQKKLSELNRDAIKIENSNAVFSWDPSMYKTSNIGSTTPLKKPEDFFSRLNERVTTIDFNNMEASSSMVTIHKRERSDVLGSSPPEQSVVVKKRKFKIVPNETMESSGSCSQNSNFSLADSVPEDRKELLKLLKSSLATPHYVTFIKSLTAYQKESNFEHLIAAFFEIFANPSFHYLFRGMRRFIKEVHKLQFDKSIEKL